jgi:GTPase KRas
VTLVELDIINLYPGSISFYLSIILSLILFVDYPALTNVAIWKTKGFVLVYSISSRRSFDALNDFVRWVREINGPDAPFMLVGNKCDLRDEREVSSQEGLRLARTLGCDFYETSVQTATDVEQIFVDLVRRLQASKESQAEVGGNRKAEEDRRGKRRFTNCTVL